MTAIVFDETSSIESETNRKIQFEFFYIYTIARLALIDVHVLFGILVWFPSA